jgi:hypothetical protein
MRTRHPTRCAVRLLAAGVCLAAWGAGAEVHPAETPPDEASPAEAVWYAQRVSSGDTPVNVEHLWSKGRRFRSETVWLGHPITTIVHGERYVIVDRLTRTGVSIQRSAVAVRQDASRARPFGHEYEALARAGAEKIGTERVAGRPCDLYRLTNDEGRREVCVTPEEDHLPVFRRVWMRASGRSAETSYVEWLRDVDVPDWFFEPEPGVTLEHFTYEQYVERAPKERIGPAPPFFRELLHGEPD